MEVLMRTLSLTMIAVGTLLAIAPARAQTFDPSYPVCMHVFTGGFGGGSDWYECSFTSLPQCNATASGRAAMCVVNPYYQPRKPPVRRKHRRSS
jgi:hypothetical protein